MAIAFVSDRHPDEGVRAEVGTIGPIEGLRGVAVLWVMLFHYLVVRDARFADPWIALVADAAPLQVILRNGYLGVDLFFLITGFLLTLPWFRHAAEGRPEPATRDFYLRRVLRIVPAYYVQLAFLFLVCLPLVKGIAYWRQDLWFLLYNAAAHATFLHYTTPLSSASLTLNGALWTLALEAQYYLLLPFLAPWLVRAPWRTAGALALAALAWRWLSAHDLEALVGVQLAIGAKWSLPESVIRHLLTTQLPGYLAHFAAGILCGRAWLAWRARPAGAGESLGWLALAVASLGGLYALYAAWNARLGEFAWILTPACMGLAMLALVSRGLALARPLLANAPLAFAGRVSYSAYLYHLPLLILWNLHAPDLGWASLPAWLAFVLAVAWVSYRFVELPFMRKRTP